MSGFTTDPRCGKTYRANDQDGHCTKCHRTFVGEHAFTRHQHLDGEKLVCDDPEVARTRAGVAKFAPKDRPGTTDGIAYSLVRKGDSDRRPPWEQ